MYLIKKTSDQPPPSKIQCVRSDVNDEQFPDERNRSIDKLSDKVSQLASQINNLAVSVQKGRAPQPTSHRTQSNGLDLDDKYLLIRHARGLDLILKWLGPENWILVEAGLQCVPCSKFIGYDYIADGSEFEEDGNLPKSFVNFKTSILRHIQSGSHLQNCVHLNQMRSEEKEVCEKAKQCALTCASVAYTNFFFAESRLSYEYHIADIFNSGGTVGTKNHSKRFPGLFLPHVYNVIRSDIKNYIVNNDLPFGVVADKMTSNHLTRHMMGIRLPIWDLQHLFAMQPNSRRDRIWHY